jgi:hypothetical protein
LCASSFNCDFSAVTSIWSPPSACD